MATLYAAPRTVLNAGWSEMSFFAGPELPTDAVFARLRSRGREILSAVNNYSSRLRIKRPSSDSTSVGTPDTRNATSSHEFVFGFHPSLAVRLTQLQRLGATPVSAALAPRDSSTWVITGVLLLGIGLVLVFALPALRR
jgi:hypothetical protein